MKFKDLYNGAKESLAKINMGFLFEDRYSGPKGEVFIRLEHVDGSVEERHIDNVITKDFSLLMARLAKDPLEPRHGIFALAVGSGDTGWDLQNPPTETNTQRSLYNEIGRKAFSATDIVESGGASTTLPTNVVDFTTTYAESEAVGPIVEMGLVGGDLNEDTGITNPITPSNGPYDATVDVQGKDLLMNYLTFPVINKPATARLTLQWRITF
jgi:hypothetical protein